MPIRTALDYDRWMAKRGPIAAAMRFAMSVPGQILVNTPVFTLPQELRMDPHWRVLEIACGRAGLLRVLAHRAGLVQPPVGLDESKMLLSLAHRDAMEERPLTLAAGTSGALPFADATFNLAISAHGVRGLSDDALSSTLAEARRVLKPGALLLLWEFVPTRSNLLDRWNRWLLPRDGAAARLRSYRELQAVAYSCGFDWVQPAQLRPFLVPPIPRVSLIMGRAPEGWRSTVIDGRRVLEPAGVEA